MTTDSINEEILDIKRQLAGRFDNDLARIVADAQTREHNAITLPPRPWKSEPGDARADWKWFEDERGRFPPG